jgi:hypothetical protein
MNIDEPTMLIRIPHLYRPGMSREALYEATRGHWKVGPRRNRAELAMAVAGGIVREVYQIDAWHPAGTTPPAAPVHSEAPPDRWEFTGRVADDATRGRYIGGSVRDYFRRGNQNPIAYVNC